MTPQSGSVQKPLEDTPDDHAAQRHPEDSPSPPGDRACRYISLKHICCHPVMRFSAPVPLGRRAVGWLAHEIDAFLEAQIAKREGRAS